MAALGPPAVAQGVGSSKGKSRPALPVAPPARDPLADNDDDELLGDAINQFVDRDRKRAHLLEAAGSAAASSIGASGSAALESMREDIDNRETRQRMLRGTARLFHQRAASFQQNFLSQLTSQIAGQLDAQAEAVVAARLQSMLAAVSRSFELRMDQRESRFGCSHRWSRLAAVGQPGNAAFDRRVDPTILRINTLRIISVESLYQPLRPRLSDTGLSPVSRRLQAGFTTPDHPGGSFWPALEIAPRQRRQEPTPASCRGRARAPYRSLAGASGPPKGFSASHASR